MMEYIQRRIPLRAYQGEAQAKHNFTRLSERKFTSLSE